MKLGQPGVHAIANTTNPDRRGDVVFVHGLAGSSLGTWRRGKPGQAQCFFWPEELGKDIPDCGIWTVGYRSMGPDFGKPGMVIRTRAGKIADQLAEAGVGHRPLIFVAHSLGGLIVKALVADSQTQSDPARRRVAHSTRGIVFCGTPHRGLDWADAAVLLGQVFGGAQKQFAEMLGNAEQLDLLHEQFVEWQRRTVTPVATYAESVGMMGSRRSLVPLALGLVVPRASADPNIAGCAVHDVAEDHLSLVKPSSRQDTIYVGVLRFIQGALEADPVPAADAASPGA